MNNNTNNIELEFEEVKKRAVKILEMTKKNQKKYSKERKKIWEYMKDSWKIDVNEEYVESYRGTVEEIEKSIVNA